MLSFQKIHSSVVFMDETYDANFGEWIRNEENARIVGHNLEKYISIYDSDSIIVSIKWIVKDWTLRGIISLMKKMILNDLHCDIHKRLDIAAGVIYTWNTVFVGEFLVAMIKSINANDDKILFAELLFKDFEIGKIEEVVKQLGGKLDGKIVNSMINRKNNKRRRTDKLSKAYTVTK